MLTRSKLCSVELLLSRLSLCVSLNTDEEVVVVVADDDDDDDDDESLVPSISSQKKQLPDWP